MIATRIRRVPALYIVVALAIGSAAGAAAQDATVTFVDGGVDIRTEAGVVRRADFGSGVNGGDRIITDRRGEAELDLAAGGTVRVAPDTVFIVSGTPSGQTQSRVAAAVGSFSFRFRAAAGNEPRVGSTTSVAGVRGTELVVYVASDGTTRYEVIEGRVEIDSDGRTVALGPNDGVEVRPGRRPGQVFSFLERPIDYAVWNSGLIDEFLSSPVDSIRGLAAEMHALIDEVERRAPQSDAMSEEARRARVRLDEIREKDGDDAAEKHFTDVLTPLRIAARAEFVSFRFVVLSALSLDQYILSRLAAEIEAAYFFDADASVLREFRAVLNDVRARYERIVVPRLVPSDV